jgi:arginyl-tRNA synthetase
MGRQVAMATYGWRLLGKPKPKGRGEVWVGNIYASLNVLLEIQRIKKELSEAEENGWSGKIRTCVEELKEYGIAADELRERNRFIFTKLKSELEEKEDPYAEIVILNTLYENREVQTVEDVRNLIGYCLKGFEESLGEIEIRFDSFDFESDLVWRKKAEEVLDELKKTKYVSSEEGALILDCDAIAKDLCLKDRWNLNPNHEIPRLVLVRGDGTTLYTLRDIAYSIEKFVSVDKVINVIGYEQTLAQLQLRISLAALDKLWMGDNQTHYSYEHVKLPGIKMSGRLGRYVTLIDVLQKAVDLAYDEVEKRMSHFSIEEKKEIAEQVGYGAVKYTLLSVDPMKTVIFEWDKALNFETNSAPFIQYSHARACNILKRVKDEPEPDYSKLADVKERRLISTIAAWSGVFKQAVEELKPGTITSYCNILADRFNSFYASLHVLNAEDDGLRGARVELVNATRIVLRNALNVIGIEAPEKM